MDIQASVLLPDVDENTDLEGVHHTLSGAVSEWCYPEVARQQPQVKVAWAQPQSQLTRVKEMNTYPIFCVSDLHLGDKGPRDNFEHMSDGRRPAEFKLFLDYVEAQKGRLFILGDLFELWQSNISKVLTCRMDLLNRLASMRALYVLGNHDADLLHFASGTTPDAPVKLSHPFFQRMVEGYMEQIDGRDFYFIHGHQADPYCAGDVPGLGRITAIYAGIKEDRRGGPLWNKYKTVEEHSIGRLDRWSAILRRLIGQPNRYKAMNLELRQIQVNKECDVLVSGHTHSAGQLYSKDWGALRTYNTGTWAERVNSFVVINNQGQVGVFDWVNGKPVPNQTHLLI